MNQYMTPGLYAVLPEIVEDAVSPLAASRENKRAAWLATSNRYRAYRRSPPPEPIVIKLPANSSTNS